MERAFRIVRSLVSCASLFFCSPIHAQTPYSGGGYYNELGSSQQTSPITVSPIFPSDGGAAQFPTIPPSSLEKPTDFENLLRPEPLPSGGSAFPGSDVQAPAIIDVFTLACGANPNQFLVQPITIVGEPLFDKDGKLWIRIVDKTGVTIAINFKALDAAQGFINSVTANKPFNDYLNSCIGKVTLSIGLKY